MAVFINFNFETRNGLPNMKQLSFIPRPLNMGTELPLLWLLAFSTKPGIIHFPSKVLMKHLMLTMITKRGTAIVFASSTVLLCAATGQYYHIWNAELHPSFQYYASE